MNMDVKSSNKKKIIINIFVGFILLSFISSIIYMYISNNSTNSNTRRKINEIQNDISNLYNYTETMSDFIVDNYKLPETQLYLKNDNELRNKLNDIYKIQLDLKNDNEILKNKLNNTYKIQLDLKNELSEFKNKSLKNQIKLKEDINEIKIKENELNKNFIRKTAMEYLNKYYNFYTPSFKYYTSSLCIEKILNIDYFKLFEELLNIDYENKIVSFAYFSENKIENFQLHPLYKIINKSLEYDYNWLNNTIHYKYNIINYYDNINRIWYIYNSEYLYIPPYLRNLIPFKTLCNYPIGKLGRNFIENFHNEYEYISSMISFISVSPQKFI
jgi:hypothetical protein